MSLFTDLTNAINLIHILSSFSGGSEFNPQALIKAVNYCYTLGFERSLLVLQLYCNLIEQIEIKSSNMDLNISDFVRENDKIFMIARLLYSRKDKQITLPKLHIGQPDLRPKNPSLTPWFPLHVYKDIPFLLIKGYILFGQAQTPHTYLDWCAKECQLREQPMLPNNNPLLCIDDFISSKIWQNLTVVGGVEGGELILKNTHCQMLRLQALRSVSNVYPLSKQDKMNFSWNGICTIEELELIWQKHHKLFLKSDVVWNSLSNNYELVG